MNDDLVFNLTITETDGKETPIQFNQAGLRNLIAQMLALASEAPLEPELERKLTLDDNPPTTNGFVVTSLKDNPDGAHVCIGIGPIDLQLAVSLPVLMQALETLKARTEADPASFHRPN